MLPPTQAGLCPRLLLRGWSRFGLQRVLPVEGTAACTCSYREVSRLLRWKWELQSLAGQLGGWCSLDDSCSVLMVWQSCDAVIFTVSRVRGTATSRRQLLTATHPGHNMTFKHAQTFQIQSSLPPAPADVQMHSSTLFQRTDPTTPTYLYPRHWLPLVMHRLDSCRPPAQVAFKAENSHTTF